MTPVIRFASSQGTVWAWMQPTETQLQLLILLAIAGHSNRHGLAYPSMKRLCEMARASDRAVRRTIGQLMSLGLLAIPEGRDGGRGHATVYRLVGYLPTATGGDVDDMQPTLALNPDSESGFMASKPDSKDRNPDSLRSETRTHYADKPGLRVRPIDKGRDSTKKQEGESRVGDVPASPVSPPPAAPAPPQVVVGEEPAPAASLVPSPADLVDAWNRAVAGTKLIPIERDLQKGECIALNKAMRHPKLAGSLAAWRRYCRWATSDPFLSGSRPGGYAASLTQVAGITSIDRWAQATKPQAPSYATMPVAELRQLPLQELAKNPKIAIELWRNPALIVQTAPDCTGVRPDPVVHIIPDEVRQPGYEPPLRRMLREDPEFRAQIRAGLAWNPTPDFSPAAAHGPESGRHVDVSHNPSQRDRKTANPDPPRRARRPSVH